MKIKRKEVIKIAYMPSERASIDAKILSLKKQGYKISHTPSTKYEAGEFEAVKKDQTKTIPHNA